MSKSLVTIVMDNSSDLDVMQQADAIASTTLPPLS